MAGVAALLVLLLLIATVSLSLALVASFKDSPAAQGRTRWSGSFGAERPGSPQRASRSRTLTRPAARSLGPDGGTGSLRDWHALAKCESGDNPRAVSPSGRYRGLFQFNLRTWRGVGGLGDPAKASRSEQLRRAHLLFERRGRQPWPVCGSRL